MHDDERYTLGASQRAGELVPVDGVSDAQTAYFERKWAKLGWLDPETGKLTRKGMAAKGAKSPPIVSGYETKIEFAPIQMEEDTVVQVEPVELEEVPPTKLDGEYYE